MKSVFVIKSLRELFPCQILNHKLDFFLPQKLLLISKLLDKLKNIFKTIACTNKSKGIKRDYSRSHWTTLAGLPKEVYALSSHLTLILIWYHLSYKKRAITWCTSRKKMKRKWNELTTNDELREGRTLAEKGQGCETYVCRWQFLAQYPTWQLV